MLIRVENKRGNGMKILKKLIGVEDKRGKE